MPDVLGVRWTEVPARQLEAGRVREAIDSIWGSTQGIALNPEIGFDIPCGRSSNYLFLNAELKRGALVHGMRGQAMLAGVVALQEEGVKHATVRYLVLTTPSETGVDVIVARTNGQVAFAGEARPAGERLQVELRDVGPERTPTAITGLVSNDEIRLNVRVLRGAARKAREGRPVRAA